MPENEEVTFNRFESYEFNGQLEWVAIHDEDLHFADNSRPQIKLCGATLRVRANNEWTKLPRRLKRAMVAHEIGHREMGHASIPQDNPFYRMGAVILNNSVDKREVEADRYAARLIGTNEFIKALIDLRNMPHIAYLSARELVLRARELQVKQCS